jgi:hypothetical protein
VIYILNKFKKRNDIKLIKFIYLIVFYIFLAATSYAEEVNTSKGAWQGFYGGVSLSNIDSKLMNITGSTIISGNSVSPGLHLGFNNETANFVIGAEAEIMNVNHDIGQPEVLYGGVILQDVSRLKLKVGIKLNDSLFYGVLGKSFTTLDDTTDPILSRRKKHYENGRTKGIGYSRKINQKLLVSFEWTEDSFDTVGSSTLLTTMKSATIRASYRF